METKPIVLLDVDGVVNAMTDDKDAFLEFPACWPEETWRFKKIVIGEDWYPIRFSTKVVDYINELSDKVEIRWHSTWQYNTYKLGKKIGLKFFPMQPAPEYHRTLIRDKDPYLWWKMYAPIEIMKTEQRPIIWIDDDLTLEARMDLAEATSNIAQPSCLIRPIEAMGMRQEDFDRIEAFIETL